MQVQTEHFYWYGLAAITYLVTCYVFSAVRWFHTCNAPKERRTYIWPDRKLQVSIYLCATCLLPYILSPNSEAAWLLEKSYFPCTYYFYCGVLLFCFFGTVKQWNQWRTTSWIAAIITLLAMAPLIAHAWIPGGILTQAGLDIWEKVVLVVSLVMMSYAGLSMWQVWQWIKEARDENYSNPDDFPIDYAQRVWRAPILFTPLLWPAYILDSPDVMAVMNVLLAASNILLLLNVMPVWRRETIVPHAEEHESEHVDMSTDERIVTIASEIEKFVDHEKGYLNPHLRLDDVVEHCSYSRSYVSKVFSTRFGGFSDYVNGLRLQHYDAYVKENHNCTSDAAAQASGFVSYQNYHRAKMKFDKLGKIKEEGH